MSAMKFVATAEHTGGQSDGHPCAKGVFGDPTDSFERDVEAESVREAEELAHELLREAVAQARVCDCKRRLQAGSEAWWCSVAISLWPQNQAAFDALVADGRDLDYDPYGLVPAELRGGQRID